MSEMRNQRTMKFKVGSFFLWEESLFRVTEIKDSKYSCEGFASASYGNPWMFCGWEESTMKFVSKKKNPEYWL